jgi:PKD repeat protein
MKNPSLKKCLIRTKKLALLLTVGSLLPTTAFAATIQGVAFMDTNDNGIFDAGESPRTDTTLFIRENDKADAGEGGFFTTQTDANGKYSSIAHDPGSFTIWSDIPNQWQQTAPIRGEGMAIYDFEITDPNQNVTVDFGFFDPFQSPEPPRPTNQPPQATFSLNPDQGTVPFELQLDASASVDPDGEIIDCEWQLSTGQTIFSQCFAQITLTDVGTHEIKLIVTDNQGLTATAVKTVNATKPEATINQPPIAKLSVNPKTGIAPLTVKVDGAGSYDPDGEIVNYQLTATNGQSTAGTDNQATIVFHEPSNYQICLTVTDNAGLKNNQAACEMISVTEEINKPELVPPTAKLNLSPTSGPAPQTVTLDASRSSDVDGSIVQCEWYANGQIINGCSTQITFDAAGKYNITLTVTDNDGLTGTATGSVTLDEEPELVPPTAKLNLSPTSGTAPVEVILDGNGSTDFDGNITQCEWRANGQLLDGCRTQIMFDADGEYHVTLTVTDNDGLTDTATGSVTVSKALQKPIAQFTINPTEGIAPQLVTLNALSSYDSDGGIEKCEWQASNGQTAFGCKTQMTLTQAGSHKITLTVTDNDGLTAQAEQTVTLSTPPVAQMTINPLDGVAPLTVTLDALSSYDSDGGIEKCEWQASNGQTAFGCKTQMTFNDAGQHDITLTVTDNSGLTAQAKSQTVKVVLPAKPPVAQMNLNPQNGLAPLTINLDASPSYDSDGGIEKCDWQASDGRTAFGCKTQIVFNAAGQYDITLTVTDNAGLTAQTKQTVVVEKENQAPTAAFPIDPVKGEIPLTVTLNGEQSFDPDGTITQYEWFASNGQTAFGKNASITFDKVGNYTISLDVTDNQGKKSVNNPIKTVQVGSVPPVARMEAFPNQGEAPLTVTLDGSQSFDSDGSIINYQWTSSDGQQTFGQQSQMIFNEPGEYRVTLQVTDDAQMPSAEIWQKIIVTKGGGTPPVAKFSLPASGQTPFQLALDGSDSFDPDNGLIIDYHWQVLLPGQKPLTGNNRQPTITFPSLTKIGEYTVTLTVTDEEGLQGTASQSIVINQEDENVARISFTGLNDSYAVGEMLAVDLTEEVNTNRFNRVDLWIAIQIPTGELFFRTPLPLHPFDLKPQPYKESLQDSQTTTRFLEFEVIPGMGGTYTFYALYVKEGVELFKHLEDLISIQRSNLAIKKITLANE